MLFRRTVQLPVRGKHWAEVVPVHLNQVRRASICAKSPCVHRVGIAFWAYYRQPEVAKIRKTSGLPDPFEIYPWVFGASPSISTSFPVCVFTASRIFL